ncbi:MAG: hypothetical protein ACKN9D_03360 [Actinomycetales bacterium]
MRTTLNIEDSLYRLAKSTAAQRGCSVTSLIEESLRVALQSAPVSQRLPPLFVSRQAPGLVAAIDLSDNSAVRDLLDEADGGDALP